MNRKIDLPSYCHPLDFQFAKKGDPKCDHDYPPESKDTSRDKCVHWICSKCGCEIC
ncbi:hypothetical protein LCGC14_2580070, partial [marine sediment metagenome]